MFDPYDEGWYAYNSGYSLHDNPYDYNTNDYVSWQTGWLNAEEYI